MPLPRAFFAPSFRQNRLGWYFAVLVGIMAFLASFALAAEAGLSAYTYRWDRNMQNRLTVEIPAVDDEATVTQADRVQQALALIRATPGVAKATALPDAATAQLLAPWIDQPELIKALPIPALIDIDRAANTNLTADAIHDRLKPALGEVRVEDHAVWLASLSRFVRGLAGIGGVMIALTGVTLIVAVSLLCRAIMATESETIALLHALGAEDADIARHFASHARRLTGIAAVAGFVPALLVTGGLVWLLLPFATAAGFMPAHAAALGVAMLLVPLAAMLIASLSARLSVENFLLRLP